MSIVPMIGVFTVLALVLLYLQPQRTHAIVIDLPLPLPSDLPPLDSDRFAIYTVAVTNQGTQTINGKHAGPEDFLALGKQMAKSAKQTVIHFKPDQNAKYDDAAQTLGLLWRAGLTDYPAQLCFVDLSKNSPLSGPSVGMGSNLHLGQVPPKPKQASLKLSISIDYSCDPRLRSAQ